MDNQKFTFEYTSYNDSSELSQADEKLLNEARKVTENAYAPYSNFYVGAIIQLENGATVPGTNQENASYPVGICAERTALSTASSLYPGVGIDTIAVSYNNKNGGKNDAPISPCGICRQTISEYENRQHKPIRIIMSGQSGKVYILQTAQHLLPFGFTAEDME
ncbi:cytidine deaminase [[Flexibacter] sp. ATCC 35208]|uniref:cytidine deaminase n=1 Tax=[Flexibacter] sp. ATCC 35208 TaxID=1936242 RepID=UPI0009C88812|nr:cytidine deaminase [[Flexibacter] sp. ATCC 35208]OMP80780.1 cytidine deaminase [[Flexibacter] sp. ATCC 35208]